MEDVIINKIKQFLITQPIEAAWLFGSYARGDENPNSDVDLLIRYKKGRRLGLFGIVRLKDELEQLLGKKVDIVEEGTMYPRVEKEVSKQKISIYPS